METKIIHLETLEKINETAQNILATVKGMKRNEFRTAMTKNNFLADFKTAHNVRRENRDATFLNLWQRWKNLGQLLREFVETYLELPADDRGEE